MVWRTFIKFDFPLNSNNSCDFWSADLFLHWTGNPNDSHKTTAGANDFIISRIIEPWGDDTLRWKTPPAVSPNRMPFATNVDEILVKGTKVGNEGYKINIIDFVDYWMDNPTENYGFEIRLANETVGRTLNFASSEHPDSDLRPSLILNIQSCKRREAEAGADQEICQGEKVQLDAQWGEFFTWDADASLSSTSIRNPIASPSQTTTYYLEMQVGDCKSRDSVTITVFDYPVVNISPNQTLCDGESVQITATGATNYYWTPSAGLDDRAIANPTATPNATTTYTVVGDDGNKCTSSASVDVTVKPLPKIDAGEDTKICFGESVQLRASGTSSSYKWINNTNGLVNINSATPTATPTITTTYTVEGTLGNCTSIDDVIVEVIPDFTVNAGVDQEICLDDTVFLNATSGFSVYQWSSTQNLDPINFLVSDNIKDPFIKDLTESKTLRVVVYDENGCKREDEISITVHSLPEVDAGKDTFICFGEEILLEPLTVEGSGTIEYRWLNTTGMAVEESTIRQPTIKAITTGVISYPLEITDENGCKALDNVKVSMLEKPEFEIETTKDVACQGEPVTLIGRGAIEYEWFPEEYIVGSKSRSRVVVIPPVEPQEFRFIGNTHEKCGLATSDAVSINVIELPTPRIGIITDNETSYVTDTSICKGDSIVLVVDGAESYQWLELEDSAESVGFRVLADEVTHTVYGFDQGCRGYTDQVTVKVDLDDGCFSKVWAPNVFKPISAQADSNKFFYVKGYKLKTFRVQVFDRWGEKLFESTDMEKPWDGYYEGELVTQGVYFYVIDAFGHDEEVRSTSGTVTVIY